MKAAIRIVAVFILLASFTSLACSQETPDGATDIPRHGIMHPDKATLLKWIRDYEKAPQAYIDPGIERRLGRAATGNASTSISLLGYLPYTAGERDQASCGNCWVWAGTGILEIADNVQRAIQDRRSIQFLNSCMTEYFACAGGNPQTFVDWYGAKGYSIPWSNGNASFQDGGRSCAAGSQTCSTSVSCDSIAKGPNYPIPIVGVETISTHSIGNVAAMNNIKNVLHQNRAVEFDFSLASQSDWNSFFAFWDHGKESDLWNPDDFCGEALAGGHGAHAVLLVGYNDDDLDPAKHYWIIVNSWGATTDRPNGIFRMPMHMNYGCNAHDSENTYWTRSFYTLDTGDNAILTVSRTGQGTGTITSDPAGIDCGDTCKYGFAKDAVITVTATPTSGSTFDGWTGAGCSGTGSCTITMDAKKSVSASFTPPCQYTLSGTSLTFDAKGGSKVVSILASSTKCDLPTVIGSDGWITPVIKWFYAKGKGTLTVVTKPLTGTSWGRDGWLTLGRVAAQGNGMSVHQNGVPCTLGALKPTQATFAQGEHLVQGFNVTATPSDCHWTALTDPAAAEWLPIQSGVGGLGSGTVVYNVMANTYNRTRTGKITVTLDSAGPKIYKDFRVTQTIRPEPHSNK